MMAIFFDITELANLSSEACVEFYAGAAARWSPDQAQDQEGEAATADDQAAAAPSATGTTAQPGARANAKRRAGLW